MRRARAARASRWSAPGRSSSRNGSRTTTSRSSRAPTTMTRLGQPTSTPSSSSLSRTRRPSSTRSRPVTSTSPAVPGPTTSRPSRAMRRCRSSTAATGATCCRCRSTTPRSRSTTCSSGRRWLLRQQAGYAEPSTLARRAGNNWIPPPPARRLPARVPTTYRPQKAKEPRGPWGLCSSSARRQPRLSAAIARQLHAQLKGIAEAITAELEAMGFGVSFEADRWGPGWNRLRVLGKLAMWLCGSPATGQARITS